VSLYAERLKTAGALSFKIALACFAGSIPLIARLYKTCRLGALFIKLFEFRLRLVERAFLAETDA
jgi:hypothetical protein